MTRDQLDAIRARLDGGYPPSSLDAALLLAEVQRLQEENTVLVEANEGEPWAWQVLTKQRDAALAEVERLTAEVESKVAQNVALMGMSGRLQQEVERLNADPLPAAAWVREVERASFTRGVAAMREAAARRCEVSPIHGEKTTTARKYADAVRALPDPEDTP